MPDLICPITGEVINLADVDAMIDCLERVQERDRELYNAKLQLRQALAVLAIGHAKTRRVRGQRRRCKVEMPDDHYNQTKLREAYHAFPAIRDEFLRISELSVRLREWKKALAESGPPEFETFKKMVLAANEGPQGLPRVTIDILTQSTRESVRTEELF